MSGSPPNADLAELLSLLGPDNVRLLIQTFLREYPNLIGQLRTGDRKTQHRVAHSLKSNARVVGARTLSAHMAAIEARLSSETGPGLSPEDIAEIAAKFEVIAAELRPFSDARN